MLQATIAFSVSGSKKCSRPGGTDRRTWSPARDGVSAGTRATVMRVAANPGLEQDLRAELLDDLDHGVEGCGPRAVAQHQMLGPHAQDDLPAAIGFERAGAWFGHRESRPAARPPWAGFVRTVTSMKFIAGAPMKPATNRLTGLP